MLNDLAYIDITKDPEIQAEPEAFQLHKINQYTMQYILHSVDQLQHQSEVMVEKHQIYKDQLSKETDTIEAQDQKIALLKKEIEQLESRNTHEKYLIEQEKPKMVNNEERVSMLIDRLKEGNTSLSEEFDYVRQFKDQIQLARSKDVY